MRCILYNALWMHSARGKNLRYIFVEDDGWHVLQQQEILLKKKNKIKKLSNSLNMLNKVSRGFVHDKCEVSLHTFSKKMLSDDIFPTCT